MEGEFWSKIYYSITYPNCNTWWREELNIDKPMVLILELRYLFDSKKDEEYLTFLSDNYEKIRKDVFVAYLLCFLPQIYITKNEALQYFYRFTQRKHNNPMKQAMVNTLIGCLLMEKDKVGKAVRRFEMAIYANFIPAVSVLAWHYKINKYLKNRKSKTQIFEMFKEAANQEDCLGMFYLADIYLSGFGRDYNSGLGKFYLKKKCKTRVLSSIFKINKHMC
jgi:TPR repeat protein